MTPSALAQTIFAILLTTIKQDRKPKERKMSNISNKQKVTAFAALGAAAVFGMLSFGNGAQAAAPSHNCAFLSGVFGLRCCDGISGSQVIHVSSTCHEPKKIKYKRRPPPRPPTLTFVELLPISTEGRGKGGGKDPNEHQ